MNEQPVDDDKSVRKPKIKPPRATPAVKERERQSKKMPKVNHVTQQNHTVSNEIHNKDPPLNRPLLNNNHRPPLPLLANLDQINRNLRRRDTHTNAVKKASRNQHAHAVTARLNGGAEQPPKARKGNGITATDAIRYGARHDGADDGTPRQRGADATLCGSGGVVEVVDVLLCADYGGDGGDVEAETGIRE